MTLDPERALTGAILAHLCADPTLTASLGDPPRVFDTPPPDPAYPYVSLGRSHSTLWGGVDGEGVEHALTLSVLSRFGGLEEARAVAGLVRTSLDDVSLTLTDHRLVNLRITFVDAFPSTDWRIHFAVIRIRAVTEPLIQTNLV